MSRRTNGRTPKLAGERRKRANTPGRTGRKRAPQKRRRAPRRRRGGLGGRLGGGLAGLLLWPLRLLWRLVWRGAVVVALLVAAGVAYYAATLPPADAVLDGRARGSVTMLDRSGEVFAWRGQQFGGQITADTVAPVLRDAIVATEDKRFWNHFGVSPIGIAGAIRINLREGRGPLTGHGGSTITQQTAKLLCIGRPYDPESGRSEAEYEAECRRTTLWRKIREATYALAMEARYTKDEILTIYLNRVYLGAGTRGFEAAAQRYFGKSANEVTPSEAAMLAGLLVAPSAYAPTRHLARARKRANLILGLMQDQGYLTPEAAAAAKATPAELSDAAKAERGGYFADWLMATGPDFLTRDTTEDVLIDTTYDPKIQTAAEDALAGIFKDKVRDGSDAQAAIVVMSADGAVRAMVGGRDTDAVGGFNRATMAKRQTGSAFKPFVYAAAMEQGHSPLATVEDEPLTIDVPGSGPWSPENYTHRFHGRVTLAQALQNSLNVPAVRVSEAVGREKVRRIAAGFGIESDLDDGPAVALGTSESSLLEMTGAYAGFLNGGRSVRPYGLTELRLQGEGSPLMGASGGKGDRVISREAAGKLVWMMHRVVAGGTGHRAAIDGWQVAGKTGTTQSARDAWFLGFTADYVAGVWMGYDDNTPLTGVTGGGLPAEIWHRMMTEISAGRTPRPLPMRAPDAAARRLAEDARTGRPEAPSGTAGPRRNRERRGGIAGLLDSIFGG